MADNPLFYVIIAALVLVVGILMFGIGGFAAGRDGKKANKVMQARIVAQFVAVLLILLFVWLTQG